MRSGDFLEIFPDVQPISDTMATLCPACPQPGINLSARAERGSSPHVDRSVDDSAKHLQFDVPLDGDRWFSLSYEVLFAYADLC